jgi:hypothetical protein
LFNQSVNADKLCESKNERLVTEHRLSKPVVVGSNPASDSISFLYCFDSSVFRAVAGTGEKVGGSNPSRSTNFGRDNSSAISLGSSPSTTANSGHNIKVNHCENASRSSNVVTGIRLGGYALIPEGSIPSMTTTLVTQNKNKHMKTET